MQPRMEERGLLSGYSINSRSSSYFAIWRLLALAMRYCQACSARTADFSPVSAAFATAVNQLEIGPLPSSSSLALAACSSQSLGALDLGSSRLTGVGGPGSNLCRRELRTSS